MGDAVAMQVMLSSQGASVETRRSLETFSEFAFLCLATQGLVGFLGDPQHDVWNSNTLETLEGIDMFRHFQTILDKLLDHLYAFLGAGQT